MRNIAIHRDLDMEYLEELKLTTVHFDKAQASQRTTIRDSHFRTIKETSRTQPPYATTRYTPYSKKRPARRIKITNHPEGETEQNKLIFSKSRKKQSL